MTYLPTSVVVLLLPRPFLFVVMKTDRNVHMNNVLNTNCSRVISLRIWEGNCNFLSLWETPVVIFCVLRRFIMSFVLVEFGDCHWTRWTRIGEHPTYEIIRRKGRFHPLAIISCFVFTLIRLIKIKKIPNYVLSYHTNVVPRMTFSLILAMWVVIIYSLDAFDVNNETYKLGILWTHTTFTLILYRHDIWILFPKIIILILLQFH